MPELTPESTPPPEAPPQDDPRALSKRFPWGERQHDPPPPLEDWEQHPAFRFTFLYHFTQPGDREALEHIGRMLYDMALESAKVWPEWTETTTRTELRALVYDLQHAALYLASVVKERETVSLPTEDERLTYMVESYLYQLAKIASGIENFLGPIQPQRR
jgi:hypothetical protein